MKNIALVAALAVTVFSSVPAAAQTDPLQLIQRGNNAALWNRDYSAAARLFQQARESQRGATTSISARAELGLGICSYAGKKYDEASALLAGAAAILELDDRDLDEALTAREYLVRIKNARKDFAGALAELDAATALRRRQDASSVPGHPGIVGIRITRLAELRGQALAGLGRHQDADESCAEGIKAFEDSSNPHAPSELYDCRADALAALGRAPESARMKARAKESRRFHLNGSFRMVALLRGEGRTKEADELERSLKEMTR